MKPRYCSRCKGTEDLMPKPYNRVTLKSGKVLAYYICNPCNSARARKYRATAAGRAAIMRAISNHEKSDPRKRKAWSKVRSALQAGMLVKPDACDNCPASDVDAHHDDYDQPLVVRWLCRKCHVKLHRERRYAAA